MNLLPLTSERGLAKWGVLLKFSTSARSCMCNRSVIRKSRNKPKSRFTSPGPRSALKPAVPNRRIDGFLVQEMVSGVEAIVGARSDPLYGPLLLVGSGGVLVELAKDAALRLLPVGPGDVTAMVDGLKLAKLLGNFRGRPPVDRAAL